MIVCDTTPISNLIHLDRLYLLDVMFGRVHIPPAVKVELDVNFKTSKSWIESLSQRTIIVKSVSNELLIEQMIPSIHAGEAEAICLAMENDAKLIVIDDRDGRQVAHANRLQTIGTLGMLLHARNKGVIESVKPLMDKLIDEHHFWIKRELYHKILHLSNEMPVNIY